MSGPIEPILVGSTFFAEIVLEGPIAIPRIDARPSDSIALALRSGSPIFVADGVFEEEFGVDPSRDPERYERLRQRLKRIDPVDFGDPTALGAEDHPFSEAD